MGSVTINSPASGSKQRAGRSVGVSWSISGNVTITQMTFISNGNVNTFSLSASATSYTIGSSYINVGSGTANIMYLDKDVTPNAIRTVGVSFTIANPGPPRTPSLNAPQSGAQYYETESIGVSWTFVPDAEFGLSQSSYIVLSGSQILASGGSASSVTIPPGTLSPGTHSLRVAVYNEVGSNTTSTINFTILAGSPPPPTITTPAHNATTFPMAALEVSFIHPQEIKYARFQYRYLGETNWTTIDISSVTNIGGNSHTFTMPANRFTLGTIEFRLAVAGGSGNYTPYSAERTLHIVSSVPVTPTLVHPENGSTAYNHIPVNYQWKFNINVDLPQFRFRLQWRIQGETEWHTIEQVSANTTWIIDHGAMVAIIEWRVQTANQYAEWSPYSAIAAYYYKKPIPIVTPVAPTGGFVDPAIPQTFSWTYTSPVDLPARAAEFAMRLAGDEEWRIDALGPVTSLLIQYDELPIGDVEWRVRMQDADEQWSEWTGTLVIQTKDVVPEAPTPIEPIGVYIPVNSAIRFSWIHNSPIGTAQAAADIEYTIDGSEPQLIHIDSSAQSTTTQPFAITPGAVQWKVRTYNRDGLESPWSAINLFSVTGAAVNPTILSASANGARPTMEWVAAGQVIYQVELLDAVGNLLDMHEEAAQGDRSRYMAPMFVPDGTYTMRVRAKNGFNFWSDWVQTAVSVETPLRLGPLIGATPEGLMIRLDLDGIDWTAVDRVIIYRDGTAIINGQGNVFYDRTASGNEYHEYFARAIYGDNTFADGPTVRARITLISSVITPILSDGDGWEVRINRDSAPVITSTGSRESELIEVIGRKKPIAEYGEHIRVGRNIVMAELGIAETGTLTMAYEMDRPVLLRDINGGRAWCRIGSISRQGVRYGERSVQMLQVALDDVDYTEGVEID